MNSEFFALAFVAALNPKLLAIDLLLIENRRPRAMFVSILAGGLSMAIAVGLVDVLVVQADTIKKQRSISAGVDLAIGLILLILGLLLMTGLPWLRRRLAAKASTPMNRKPKGNGWAQHALSEPRLVLAFTIGALIGLPGASYIAALHNLVAGNYSTGTRVLAVIVFSVIVFLLILIPWLSLELWPAGTAAFLRRAQAWLTGHARQLIAWVAVLLGTYLVIGALVQLA